MLGLIGEIVRQGAGVGIHILATRADGPAIYLYQANLLAAEVSAFDTGAITLDGL